MRRDEDGSQRHADGGLERLAINIGGIEQFHIPLDFRRRDRATEGAGGKRGDHLARRLPPRLSALSRLGDEHGFVGGRCGIAGDADRADQFEVANGESAVRASAGSKFGLFCSWR